MVKRDSKPFQIAIGRVAKATSMGDLNSVKNQQAYMYPDGKIVRAPSVLINGRYYSDPRGHHHSTAEELALQSAHQGKLGLPTDVTAGQPRRSVESNFLITINPNRKWGVPKGNGEDATIMRVFHQSLMAMTTNENFLSLLKVPSKTKTPHYTAHYQRDGQEWTDNEGQHLPWVDVLNGPVKWDSTVEIGEKQHRMHAHCVVEIRHYSQIQFNIEMIQHTFRREFNLAMDAAGVPQEVRRLTGKPYVDVQLLKQNNSKDIVYRYVRKMVGGKSVEINVMPR